MKLGQSVRQAPPLDPRRDCNVAQTDRILAGSQACHAKLVSRGPPIGSNIPERPSSLALNWCGLSTTCSSALEGSYGEHPVSATNPLLTMRSASLRSFPRIISCPRTRRRTSMRGSTMPSRRPSDERSGLGDHHQGPGLTLIGGPFLLQAGTSRPVQGKVPPSTFWIRYGRRSTMLPGVPPRSLGPRTATASAMRGKSRTVSRAQHYARDAQRLVTRHTTGNPLLSLFVAGAPVCARLDDPWRETKPRPTRAGLCQDQTWLCFAG